MNLPSSESILANLQSSQGGLISPGLAGSRYNISISQMQAANTSLGSVGSASVGGAGGYGGGGQGPGAGSPSGSGAIPGGADGNSASSYPGGQDPGNSASGLLPGNVDPPPDEDDDFDDVSDFSDWSGLSGTGSDNPGNRMPPYNTNASNQPPTDPGALLGCTPCTCSCS